MAFGRIQILESSLLVHRPEFNLIFGGGKKGTLSVPSESCGLFPVVGIGFFFISSE